MLHLLLQQTGSLAKSALHSPIKDVGLESSSTVHGVLLYRICGVSSSWVHFVRVIKRPGKSS